MTSPQVGLQDALQASYKPGYDTGSGFKSLRRRVMSVV